MSLEISDGFNFAIGKWMADVTVLLIGGAIILAIAAVIYGGISLYEWWYWRRLKE